MPFWRGQGDPMKSLITAILFLSSFTLGQGTSTQKDTSAKPHQKIVQASDHDMMAKCMESMAKALPVAEKTLNDMKAALGQMKDADPAAKRLAELNVQMWEAEVGHMKEMATTHDAMKTKMKTMHSGMDSMKDDKETDSKK
jgi:hypothetical protein